MQKPKDSEPLQRLVQRIEAANVHFLKPETQAAIRKACENTFTWLNENEASYSGNNLRDSGWWPGKLELSKSRYVMFSRRQTILFALWGNGMRKTLHQLGSGGVLKYDYEEFDKAVAWPFFGLFVQFIGFEYGAGQRMSLASAATFCDYKNSTHFRDAHIGNMVELGLWNARASEGWQIWLGPLARQFYEVAFDPIFREILEDE